MYKICTIAMNSQRNAPETLQKRSRNVRETLQKRLVVNNHHYYHPTHFRWHNNHVATSLTCNKAIVSNKTFFQF